MAGGYIDEYPLTRFGAELQAAMNDRGLDLEKVSHHVTDRFPERSVSPRLVRKWMTGAPLVDVDLEHLRVLADALELEGDAAARLALAYLNDLRQKLERDKG